LSIDREQMCDLCGSMAFDVVYSPLKSRYEVNVLRCSNCNLVQSQKNIFPNQKIRSTSSDADWGNVRHGKGLRFDLLKVSFDLHGIVHGNVLDIGSNRGDFVNWAESNRYVSTVVAIEPDSSIVLNYDKKITLYNDRLENIVFSPIQKFDFIYICQTLEHANSARDMIENMCILLASGGRILLDVPNLEVIKKTDIIEEFFIDKHKFHFTENCLMKYFAKFGLYVEAESIDMYNISFLLSKNEDTAKSIKKSNNITVEDFKTYSSGLSNNRKKLSNVVEQRIAPLIKRQKCAIWGAGRTLDALIKYGDLPITSELTIVDSYLHDKIKVLEKFDVLEPSSLKLIEPDVIFILANSAEEQLAKQAYRMGIRHVLKFSEMMEQI
jgi:SAM-dependent methyltransferase